MMHGMAACFFMEQSLSIQSRNPKCKFQIVNVINWSFIASITSSSCNSTLNSHAIRSVLQLTSSPILLLHFYLPWLLAKKRKHPEPINDETCFEHEGNINCVEGIEILDGSHLDPATPPKQQTTQSNSHTKPPCNEVSLVSA